MADDYTPTTRTFGHGSIALTYYPSSRRVGVVQVGTNAVMDAWEFREFARESGMLSAHDAALRAEWEAEQGEVEWEYECRIPPFEWKTCTEDPRFCPDGTERRRRRRRHRKAGPWVPVNENGETP